MATEQELWRLIGNIKEQLREAIARAEAAEARVRELEEVLSSARTALAEKYAPCCFFCNETFPEDDNRSDDEWIALHMRTCRKHPMRIAEARIADLESRLAALQWRPIAEYDAMAVKPDNYVFCDADPDISDPLSLTRFPHDTHFLQLPPVPGESP